MHTPCEAQPHERESQERAGHESARGPPTKTRESLTESNKVATIRAMTRDVLQAILRAAPGLAEKAGSYRVANEHRATFYLGNDGRGMVVNEVEAVKLSDSHVQITSKELGEVLCSYDSVAAIAIKPPKESGPSKTGFA
jgi:hypothetical protein